MIMKKNKAINTLLGAVVIAAAAGIIYLSVKSRKQPQTVVDALEDQPVINTAVPGTDTLQNNPVAYSSLALAYNPLEVNIGGLTSVNDQQLMQNLQTLNEQKQDQLVQEQHADQWNALMMGAENLAHAGNNPWYNPWNAPNIYGPGYSPNYLS